MELPKNITQIGEVDRDCKVYVEDYVVSYIKQLNRLAEDKDMAVSLFGRREEEDNIVYYFIYGASKLNLLQKDVRHLSQAQNQEIERWRRKYFPELAFVGYRLLNGEMIEGFHICDKDVCRYISGYAQFYEKNDAMLAYMLAEREEAQPEQVDQGKYEEVKQRQEERRSASEAAVLSPKKILQMPETANLQKMRLAAAGVFALLCLFGIATFREMDAENSYGQYNVESVSGTAVQGNAEKDTLLMEDKLEQALRTENQTENHSDNQAEGVASQQVQEETLTEEQANAEERTEGQDPKPEAAESQAIESATDSEENGVRDPKEQDKPETASEAEAINAVDAAAQTQAVAYVIQPGDTLIAISKRQYGTENRVMDICTTNKITNPDNIKEGQVIMLPR